MDAPQLTYSNLPPANRPVWSAWHRGPGHCGGPGSAVRRLREGQRQILGFLWGDGVWGGIQPILEWIQKHVPRATAAGTGRGNNGREESWQEGEQEGSLQITKGLSCGREMQLVLCGPRGSRALAEVTGRQEEAPNKEEFSPEQLHRSRLPREAASPQPREHSSRGAVTPAPRLVAEGVSSLNEDWTGGPWKSLPALRFRNSMASKPLQ